MAIYALTGNDTLTINGKPITELCDQSTVTVEYQGAKLGHTTGKNGNTVFSTDKQGQNATVTIRVIAGGRDDSYLNGLMVEQDRDLPTFPLITGTFTKRIGDGKGNVKFLNYALNGGGFENGVNASENLQGDNETGIAVYTLFFANAERAVV